MLNTTSLGFVSVSSIDWSDNPRVVEESSNTIPRPPTDGIVFYNNTIINNSNEHRSQSMYCLTDECRYELIQLKVVFIYFVQVRNLINVTCFIKITQIRKNKQFK